jgi:hypothetical protein
MGIPSIGRPGIVTVYAVEAFAWTAAGRIAVLGAPASVEYIVPATFAGNNAVIEAPMLFIPTSPDIVEIPVINVWARTEKLVAAPRLGFVAASAVSGAARMNAKEAMNIVVGWMVFFIE